MATVAQGCDPTREVCDFDPSVPAPSLDGPDVKPFRRNIFDTDGVQDEDDRTFNNETGALEFEDPGGVCDPATSVCNPDGSFDLRTKPFVAPSSGDGSGDDGGEDGGDGSNDPLPGDNSDPDRNPNLSGVSRFVSREQNRSLTTEDPRLTSIIDRFMAGGITDEEGAIQRARLQDEVQEGSLRRRTDLANRFASQGVSGGIAQGALGQVFGQSERGLATGLGNIRLNV